MSDIPASMRFITPAVLVGVFLVFLALERLVPLRRLTRPWLGRLVTNAVMSGLTFLAGMIVIKSVTGFLMGWSLQNSFGLLYLGNLWPVLQVGIGFLFMDLTFYYWHRTTHEVRFLWRFHRVHHIDPGLDVSSSFRFHFAEIILSVGFRAAQVVLLGIAPVTYVIYELFFQGATLFHHSNIRLPIGLERVLNKVIVTPRMHGIHHSAIIAESNSNYSVIFRWWDALHRSLRLNVPQSQITIGVAGFQQAKDNTVAKLLLTPLARQKPLEVEVASARVYDSQSAPGRRGYMLK